MSENKGNGDGNRASLGRRGMLLGTTTAAARTD